MLKTNCRTAVVDVMELRIAEAMTLVWISERMSRAADWKDESTGWKPRQASWNSLGSQPRHTLACAYAVQ
jgi:hypothetical protein